MFLLFFIYYILMFLIVVYYVNYIENNLYFFNLCADKEATITYTLLAL